MVHFGVEFAGSSDLNTRMDSFSEKLSTVKREVDALQISLSEEMKPWFKQASTIVAVIALIFSFGTTFVSYQRTNQLDINSDRKELREILNRLSTLPIESFNYSIQFANNNSALNTINSFIANEQSYLAQQAAELATRIPENLITAQEYTNIAHAMLNQMWMDRAIEFYETAVKKATDFNTENSALRSLSMALFQSDKPDKGRRTFQKAMIATEEYKDISFVAFANSVVLTRLAWANSEFYFANNRSEALNQIKFLNEFINDLAEPGLSIIKNTHSDTINKLDYQIKNNIKTPFGLYDQT